MLSGMRVGPGKTFPGGPVARFGRHPSTSRRAGMTLTELLVATFIISIGILGMTGAFKYMSQAIQGSKGKSLANNLAQEKIEVLKNKSYYMVLVTTATTEDDNFDPPITYDTAPNAPEALNVGGINFERRVYIRKVSEDGSGNLTRHSWTTPDTGLKEILVYVVWKEGGGWKKVELRNLRDNPNRTNLTATFSGAVADTGGGPLVDATVRVQENPAKYGETDAAGNYSFAIEPGGYTLLASKPGYFASRSPLYNITTTQSHNFQLPAMASGTVRGTAYKRDHPVIYMVVASSGMVNGDQVEFVSLYNPTTSQINMLTDPAVSTSNNIKLAYYGQSGEGLDVSEFWLQHRSTFIPAGYHYLIASTGTFIYKGAAVTADAVYTVANRPPCSDVGALLNCIRRDKAGAIRISDVNGNVLDTLGWSNTGAGKTAPYYEGTSYPLAGGLPEGAQFFRFTGPGYGNELTGSCYDTDANNLNFSYSASPDFRTMAKADGSKPPVTGTPAAGAVVFTGDGLSNPVIATSTGAFDLVGVATGTWSVYISSGLVMSTRSVTGAAAGFSAALGDVALTSANIHGYITGTVTNVSAAPLPSIMMYAGGFQTLTNSAGGYTLPGYPGETSVTANYQTASPTYVEISSIGVTVALGQLAKNVDFVLENGGKIRGWVTTNGTDPLPNIPVTALEGGVEKGSGISGGDGYYLIWGAGISTGTYAVSPQLESGVSATPSSHTVALSAGQTIFAGTFTVSGAMGYIYGSATASTAAITTGVLVYASTSVIAGSPVLPPTINSALRSGSAIYYAVSSNARGQYSLPVRGGYTYNIYAWYTTWRGDTPSISVRQFTGVGVSAGQSVERNFVW